MEARLRNFQKEILESLHVNSSDEAEELFRQDWQLLLQQVNLAEALELLEDVWARAEEFFVKLQADLILASAKRKDYGTFQIAYLDFSSILRQVGKPESLLELIKAVRPLLANSIEFTSKIELARTYVDEIDMAFTARKDAAATEVLAKAEPYLNFVVEHPTVDSMLDGRVHLMRFAGAMTSGNETEAFKALNQATEKPDTGSYYKLMALQWAYQHLSDRYKYAAATELAEQAYLLAQKEFGYEEIIDAAIDLASIYFSDGEYKKVIAALEGIDDGQYGELGPYELRRLLNRRLSAAAAIGEASLERETYAQLTALVAQLEDEDLIGYYDDTGRYYVTTGRYFEAKVLFEKGLELAEKLDEPNRTVSHFKRELSVVLERLGDFEEALAILDTIDIDPSDLHAQVDLLNVRGNVLIELNQYDRAEQSYREVIALVTGHDSIFGLHAGAAYNGLALSAEERGDKKAALDAYRKGLAIDDADHNDFARQVSLYNIGNLLCDERQYAAAAPYLLEALALQKSLHGERLDTEGGPELQDEWAVAVELLVEAYAEQGDDRAALLYASNIHQLLSGADISQLALPELSRDETLIVWSGFRRRKLYAFTYSNSNTIAVHQINLEATEPPAESLPNLTHQPFKFRNKLKQRYRTYWPQAASRFTELCSMRARKISPRRRKEREALRTAFSELFAPIWKNFPFGKTLLFLADHTLGQLPFHLLTIPEKTSAAPTLLGEAYVLKSLPLSWTNQNLTRTRLVSTSLLTWRGGTDNRAGQLETELSSICANYDTYDNVSLTENCTEIEAVQALQVAVSKSNILHFVGHAFADANGGGLLVDAIAGGKLRSNTLHSLQLDGQVVVLAACSTGTGPTYAGWGARTVARTFLACGARAVVASLWNVDNDGSIQLMKLLHAGLAAGSRIETALGSAQQQRRDAGAYVSEYAGWVTYV